MRSSRIEFPGATYHVMSHGVDSTPLFLDDSDRYHFLDSLQELVEAGKLLIHAFVLMLNHFHLLCETPLAGLSRHMQQLLGRHALWFNSHHDRRGHLLRARYKALLVEGGEYFLECSRYIHYNPVKAEICADPGDYPWSSYLDYIGPNQTYSWVTKARTLNHFSNSLDYRRFVLQPGREELEDQFEKSAKTTIWGSKEFAERMAPLARTRKPFEKLGLPQFTPKSLPIIEFIQKAIDEFFLDLSKCQRNRIFIYSLRRFTGKTGTEIAAFAGRSPSAVTHIWNSIQLKLRNDSELERKICALARFLDENQVL